MGLQGVGMDKVIGLWVKRETHVHISIPGRGQCAHGVAAADQRVKIPPHNSIESASVCDQQQDLIDGCRLGMLPIQAPDVMRVGAS